MKENPYEQWLERHRDKVGLKNTAKIGEHAMPVDRMDGRTRRNQKNQPERATLGRLLRMGLLHDSASHRDATLPQSAWDGELLVRWKSECGRYAIVTVAGHSGWMGVGWRGYFPATHFLVDLSRAGACRGIELQRITTIREMAGRLAAKTIAGATRALVSSK